ncbi:hypothetical protein [Microbispora bryophytorum]|uniref:hypothetical protein n=1 Tax=Microbispora bryophytorum TaxID=1460882 RepID=UPI0033CD0D3D
MSRSRARDPRDTKVSATVLSIRRLAMAALVIAGAGIAVAQPAIARVAPHHPREGLTALRNPRPGGDGQMIRRGRAGGGQTIKGGRAGGGQTIKGGRAGGGQGQSGAGRFNQNLTGVVSPTFVQGKAQQAVTDHGAFEVQSTFCGSQPDNCWVGQNMPARHGS